MANVRAAAAAMPTVIGTSRFFQIDLGATTPGDSSAIRDAASSASANPVAV
jgi:hypothetical protein